MASSSVSKRSSNSKTDRTCQQCDSDISHRGNRAVYCESCARKIKNEKARLSQRVRRARNPEKKKAADKRYKKKHAEKIRLQDKRYRINNPKKVKLWKKRSYEKNKAAKKIYDNQYRKNNPEKIKLRDENYRKNNRERIKERDRKRYKRVGKSYRKTDTIRRLIQRDGLICGICKEHLNSDPFDGGIVHIDHKIPNGNNHISNLQLSHKSCNLAKGNRFIQPNLSTDKTEQLTLFD